MIGRTIGPYQILAELGRGGMGEVYRARDVQLNRDVAIKVLPALVADDPERLMRFEREAQTLAALSHPHIATIFGLEHAGHTGPGQTPVRALVMELVEGPTLSERIAQGPIAWSEALLIARQIADALEAAHEKGIVHRDLKPANIKLTAAGDVKVLDFGLAKAMDPSSASGDVSNSPTLTARATQMGMILGTAAYMSPEQARGKVVDRRADIWAFGCVIYELLTRRRVFEGDEVTDVLARLIERDPDWSALPPGTSPDMRRLLMRCLTKDPKARLRDIGEARVAIDDMIAGKTTAGPADAAPRYLPAPLWQRVAPWMLAVIFAGVSAAVYFSAPAAFTAARPSRVELALPADVEFFSGPSISADGTRIAFIGVRHGIRQGYTRSLDEVDMRQVPGTETASTVSLSADGGTLVFVTTDGSIKRLIFTTGIVEPLATGVDLFSSPALAHDGSIAFSRGRSLVVLPPSGAERELAAAGPEEGESNFTWPIFGAGDSVVLFKSAKRESAETRERLEAVPVGGGARRVVIDGDAQAIFATNDRLVYTQDGALFTAGFDPVALAIRGVASRLGEAISVGQNTGAAVAVADTGALILAPPSVLNSHLVWVSATGVERMVKGPSRGFQNPRVSPDGRLIAFTEGGTLWTFDPERGTFTRVSPKSEAAIGFPAWSKDSTMLFYRSRAGVRRQRADGEGDAQLLPNTGQSDYPSAVSLDGSTLVLLRISPAMAGGIYSTPTTGGEVKPVVDSKAYEGGPQVSPDSKWLLYVSNESGHMEVYLRPLGGPDRKWPVSAGGGLHPLWSKDGRRIFYRSGQQMVEVDVTTTPEVRLSAPRVLFERRYQFGPNLTFPNYSLSPDGREFLMVQEDSGGRHLKLVLNWFQTLGRN